MNPPKVAIQTGLREGSLREIRLPWERFRLHNSPTGGGVNLRTANANDALLQWRSRKIFPTEFGSIDIGVLFFKGL